MAEYIEDMPDVEFGDNQTEEDWRKNPDEDSDDSDAPASPDLIAMLGFDPDKIDEEGNDLTYDQLRNKVFKQAAEGIKDLRESMES